MASTGRVEETTVEAKMAPTERTQWSDARITGLLFVGALAVYLAVGRGQQYAYDGQSMLAVTRNLVDHGTLKTVGAFVDPYHQSTPYSPYGIAMSLLGAPPYALSKVVGHAAVLVSWVNPLLTAAAVAVTYRVARALSWRGTDALMAAVAYGLLSMAVQASTEYFSEPGVTLCVLVMLLGVIRWGQGRRLAPLMVGLAAGAALQFRSDSLFTVWVGLLAVPLFVPFAKLRRFPALAAALAPMAASVALLVAYNELRYGKVFVTSYGGQFSTPVTVGLHGLLLSAGKSLFVFNPLAALGAVGLVVLLFRHRPLAVILTLLIVPRLVFFARWSAWQGGWSWGPRFLLPTVPLLMLAAVEVLRVTRRASPLGIVVRLAAALLASASLVVTFLSVRVPYEQWLEVLNVPADRAALHLGYLPTFSSQLGSYEYQPARSPLWGDVILLRHHMAEMAPQLWRQGHGTLGVVLLVAGLLLTGLAVVGAQERRGSHAT